MKKVFITLIAVLAISTSVMADGHADSVRYLTTKAWKNWYISASGTCNWWQGSLRTPDVFEKSYTAVEWGKPTFGFNVFVGKWINHKIGVRLGYSNTQIYSYIYGRHIGLNHIQYLYHFNGEPELVESHEPWDDIYRTSMRYHRLEGDFMLSPIDFFQGYYNPKRVWSPVLYLSMGGAFTSKDFFAIKSYIEWEKAKKIDPEYPPGNGYNFELALGAGLSNNFRLCTHFDLNLDLNWTFQRWTLDSWTYEVNENSVLRPKRFDNMYTASVGVIYYFSREYDLPINCCEEMESMKNKLDEFVNCDTIVKFVNVESEEAISYPFSIFFHRDSYELMSRRDIVNLKEIAQVAKENGYKLKLTGSCDSATATPSYNQTLSENRCRKIMSELMELGIPESQIILDPIGGVKHLDPTEYDRRVLIQLVKEAQ